MNSPEPQIKRRSQSKSAEAIDVRFLSQLITALSILVVILALLEQIELMIGVLVTASIGIAWWALGLHEQSQDGTNRFRELRRIARLRNEDVAKPSLAVVFGIAAILGVFFLGNLSSSWKQFRATDLSVVPGQITRHEMVDVDLGSQLEVEYEYQVAGTLYHGNRLRFVYRAYRVGTADAKKLAATWRLGNRVSVFYNPDSPTDAVLDNTFCKGDELHVGLNATGLMLSMLVIVGVACAQLQSRDTEIVVNNSDGTFAIRLSSLPLFGTFAMLLATGSLIVTFVALIAGLIAMGNAELPWLVRLIDCLYVVTGTLFGIAGTIYVGERALFGLRGRELVVDNFTRTISWPSETFGETVNSDFAHVKSLRVVSSRDDWYRMGRTFSVVASYADDSGALESRIIQRSYGRHHAVALAAAINSLIAPKPEVPVSVSEERRKSVRGDSTRSVNSLDSVFQAQN